MRTRGEFWLHQVGPACAFALTLTVGHAAGGQVEAPPPVLAINSAGIDAMLSAEKDRPLRELLHMVAPRLSELPAELERFGMRDFRDMPDGLFETLWFAGSSPQALELRLNLGRLRNQEVPVDVRWMASADDFQSAANAMGFVRNALRDTPLRLRASTEAGTFIADTPVMPLYLGTKQLEGSQVLFFSTESAASPDLHARYVDLPDGAEQVFGMRFDLGQLTPVIGMPIGLAPPIVGELLMEAGLVGWNATRFDLAIGHDQDKMHSAARLTGVARAARMFVTDTNRVLSKADFEMVPGDATTASLGFYDASRTWSLAVRVLERLGLWQDVQQELSTNLNIDVSTIEQILGSLGDTWITYQSDTTGGGEFTSLIVSVSVRDRAVLEQAIAVAAGTFNAVGRDAGHGYARVRAWEHRGVPIYSVNTPGLPIPVEPAFVISGDRLLIAMSVPSLMAAIEQQQGGERSLADREDIMALVGGSFDGMAGFSFTDTERYARRGYGTLNHLMAGLANGVRSPLSDREPYERGAMMLSFGDFTRDIVPTVTLTRWAGEDLMITGVSDRSVSVQLAARMGKASLGTMASQFAPILSTVGSTSLVQARETAQSTSNQARSMQAVHRVMIGAIAYSVHNDMTLPTDSQQLIESEAVQPAQLRSPFGSMMDGRPDIAIRPDLGDRKFSEIEFPGHTVYAIDRSALLYSGSSAVVFVDGHVQWLTRAEIQRVLERPENHGAREAFGF